MLRVHGFVSGLSGWKEGRKDVNVGLFCTTD